MPDPLFFTISRSLLKLMSIGSVMPSNHLILYCPSLLCLQSFPVSLSFPMSHLFALGGQNTGASVSVPVLPMNIQGSFPLGLTVLIFLLSKGLSRVFSNTIQFKSINFPDAFFIVQFSHSYITTGKTIALTKRTFVGKVMSLLFNTLSRLITAFLPRR